MEIKERLCSFTAQDLKKHELLRVATATDAAEIADRRWMRYCAIANKALPAKFLK